MNSNVYKKSEFMADRGAELTHDYSTHKKVRELLDFEVLEEEKDDLTPDYR